MSDTELTMDDLHDETSTDVAKAYSEETRMRTGVYYGRLVNVKLLQRGLDDAFNPGRKCGNLMFEVYTLDDATTKVGTVYVNTSWEIRLTRSGKLDAAARNYAELRKALTLKGKSGPAQVYAEAKTVLLKLRIQEMFVVAADDVVGDTQNLYTDNEGKCWVNIPATEEGDALAEDYFALGYESKAQVKRITKGGVPF